MSDWNTFLRGLELRDIESGQTLLFEDFVPRPRSRTRKKILDVVYNHFG
jgi:hypothetical protein